jgi:hypothetical protein
MGRQGEISLTITIKGSKILTDCHFLRMGSLHFAGLRKLTTVRCTIIARKVRSLTVFGSDDNGSFGTIGIPKYLHPDAIGDKRSDAEKS